MGKALLKREYIIQQGIRVAAEFTPTVYGRLTSIGPAFSLTTPGKKRRRWFQVFQCSCGTILSLCLEGVTSGDTTSCGCYRTEALSARSILHGMRKSPEYTSWALARARCYRPSCPVYPYYGGRGVRICARWQEPKGQGFLNFLEDMGRKPSPKHSLDRIDVNGDYCPENCRWATQTEQSRNRRTNILLTYNNKTMCSTEWAAEVGLAAECIRYRKEQGWSDEKTLTTPVRKTERKNNG